MPIKLFLAFILMLGCAISQAQIEILNDEFSDPETLENWKNVNREEGWNVTQLESYNINDSIQDRLFMLPFTEGWFQEYKGAYLYKMLAGDFVLTTKVTATARDGMNLPSSLYSLAGIMIREAVEYPTNDPETEWLADQQNYVFMSIGQANGPSFNFEIKNTCSSNSCLSIVDIDTSTVTIRMMRHGNEIVVLSKIYDDWEVLQRFHREETQTGDLGDCGGDCDAPFPDTLQIGFVAYTDWPKVSSYTTNFHNNNTLHPDSLLVDPTPGVDFNPDLRASFEYARFDSLGLTATQDTLNFFDETETSDSLILALFGYDTAPFCPDTLTVFSEGISDRVMIARALNELNSSMSLDSSSIVKFYAEEEILLQEGFQTKLGTKFEALIEVCPQQD